MDRWRSCTRSFSVAENCLNESRRSCSTLAVALSLRPTLRGAGAPAPAGFRAAVNFWADSDNGFEAAVFESTGPLEASAVADTDGSAFAASGTGRFSVAGGSATAGDFVEVETGRAICDEMMAGSTGTPGIDGEPVGARLAGAVYLPGCPVGSGGKSRRTPLYLHTM